MNSGGAPTGSGVAPGPHRRWANTLGVLLAIAFFLALAGIAESVTSERADRAAVKRTICQVFGPRCGQALRVSYCETGGTYDPRARGSAGERGLFQIHPVHFGWVNEARLYQPRYNSRIAFRLSRGGRDWSAWTCQP